MSETFEVNSGVRLCNALVSLPVKFSSIEKAMRDVCDGRKMEICEDRVYNIGVYADDIVLMG